MRRSAALLAVLALAGCGSGLTRDQRDVLEAIASDETGSICLQPVLRGGVGQVWARIPPKGFEDLAERLASPRRDVPMRPGTRYGKLLFSDNPDCFEAVVPEVSGDRAAVAIRGGMLFEFGLRRQGDRWIIAARSSPDI